MRVRQGMQSPPFPLIEAPSSNAGDGDVYAAVLEHVDDMFDAIRGGLLDYDVSNYIRASLLQPITSLATKQVRPAWMLLFLVGARIEGDSVEQRLNL